MSDDKVNYVVVNSCERHKWFTKQVVATIVVVVTVERLTEQLKNGSCNLTKQSIVATLTQAYCELS